MGLPNSIVLFRKTLTHYDDPVCTVDETGFPTICIQAQMVNTRLKEPPCQWCNVYHALSKIQKDYQYVSWKGWMISNPPKLEVR